MDPKASIRRDKTDRIYETAETKPHDQRKADKALDQWIRRNKDALEESLSQARQGKAVEFKSTAQLMARIKARRRKRSSAKPRK